MCIWLRFSISAQMVVSLLLGLPAFGQDLSIQAPVRFERLPPVVATLHPQLIPDSTEASVLGFQLVREQEILSVDARALVESPLFVTALDSSPDLASLHHKLQRLTNAQQQLMESGAVEDARLHEEIETVGSLFYQKVLEVGVNGAMVARQERTDVARFGMPDQSSKFVLLEAIGNSPQDNTGFARTAVYANGQVGMTTVNAEYLLPITADSNDLFHNLVEVESRMPDGVMVKLTDDPAQNPIARILLMPRFGAYFDTGFVGSGNFAQSVSLASQSDPRAGQTKFIQEGGNAVTQFDLLTDTQIFDVGGQTVQFFLEANNELNVEQLRAEQLGVRAYNRQSGSAFEGWALAVGKHNTVYGYTGMVPAAYDAGNTLIGTVDRRNTQIPQLAIHAPVGQLAIWKMAIEDPYDGDVFYGFPASARANLRRLPTVATSIRWENADAHDLVQLGALVRSVGFESIATGQEQFETLWGLSGLAKFGTPQSALVLGVAGGDGVGDYIRGVTHSAVATPTSLTSIRGVGGFAGYQRLWIDDCGTKVSQLNAAYGYSHMETPALIGLDVDQKLHQAWINYTRFLSEYVAVGMEYQYGMREVASGDVGEDHRFMLLVAIQSGKDKKATALRGEGVISGMLASDVVNQTQAGGPAFLQDF